MFKFKLQALFKFRKRNKELILKKWIEQTGQLNLLEKQKLTLHEQHKEHKNRYTRAIDEGQRQQAMILRSYIDGFKQKFKNIDGKIETQKQIIESLRAQMNKVSQDFEIIKKLRENKHKQYQEAEDKKEQKFNDELSVLKSKRGKSFGSI